MNENWGVNTGTVTSADAQADSAKLKINNNAKVSMLSPM